MASHKSNKFDPFSSLIIFFLILLLSLFVYLQKMEKDVKNYSLYQSKLQNMISYNLTMEKVFLRKFRYINYDTVVKITKNFESDIAFLKDSNLRNEFGEKSYKRLLDIEDMYRKKLDILEHFQSPNARATNAIHYLFDLRKTIGKEFIHDIDKQYQLYDQTFFHIGKILMWIPVRETVLTSEIDQLKKFSSDNKYFNYFYQQTKQFLEDAKLINAKLDLNKNLDITKVIRSLSSDMTKQYEANLHKQKIITISFFALAFIVLVILFFLHRRIIRTTHELSAFRYAIENSDNIIVMTDADKNIEYANDAFELHTGYTKEEVMGQNPRFLKSNLHSDEFYREMNETLDIGKKWDGELINRKKDGSLLYEKSSIVPISIDGEIVQYLAIKLDITDYIEQQQKLQQSAVAFETIGDGILITDKDKNILSVNPAFVNMFGYTEEELLEKKATTIDFLERSTLFYRKIWSMLMLKGRWSGKMHTRVKNSEYITIWLTITIVKDQDGDILNFIAIFTNLEEIIEMEEKANFLAYHDDLTKLPNRVSIERELVDILDLARLSHRDVAVLFIDLDRFKVINDTLGHHIGDEMLITVAQRIQGIIGKNKMLARFGGDEFVVVMSHIKDRESIERLASGILNLIREPISVEDYHLNTTASIGISIYPEDGATINAVIKNADSAMYHAKDSGKDNYKFYTQKLSFEMQTRLDLEQKLLYALERGEFRIVYQPQYNLSTKSIEGVEALLRWNNSELGEVSPDIFIPVAEETGVIVKIGCYVFEEAIKSYQHWITQDIELDWIAINLSSIQFRQENLYDNFISIVEKYEISPSRLELEITERCMMDHTEENLDFIDKFREMGASIAIDDFGTGYSSMSYLQSLPIDKIKIDKSFVDNISDTTRDQEVSVAIIKLSHSLGYKVIAEGIENQEQEDFLREHGCDYGQGFYFSRPLGSEELIDFIKKSKATI